MAYQRPPWFRRTIVTVPTPRPAAPTAPAPPPPFLVRPSVPIRPFMGPTQTQEPTTQPPPPAAASPPPPDPAAPNPPPRSPASPPAVTTPPKSSPVATPKSPVVPPPSAASPPSTLATGGSIPPRSPTIAPPPTTTVASTPISPVPKPTSGDYVPQPPTPTISPSMLTSSPVSKPLGTAVAYESALSHGKLPTSPRNVKPAEKTPPQSPKTNLTTLHKPPSPLMLPPAQIKTDDEYKEPKIEQKSVLHEIHQTFGNKSPTTNLKHSHNYHSSSNNSTAPNPHEKREVPAAATTSKKIIKSKKHSDQEESALAGMRVITLAGDNRGAVMQLSGPSAAQKKTGDNYFVGNSRRLKEANKTAAKSSSSSDDETDGGDEAKSKNKIPQLAKQSPQVPMKMAYLNSNVQGINNSILFNSECRHNDPGIHLSLTTRNNHPSQSSKHKN